MSLKSKRGEYDKGKTPTGGIDYEVKLQVLFALSAFDNLDNKWKLSNENQHAGKFDDLVLETDSGDILLQAKCKNQSLNSSRLASDSPKNDDFSLAKYFLSFMTTNTSFNITNLILCFTADIVDQDSNSKNQPLFFLQKKTVEDTMLKDVFQNSEIYTIKPKNYDDFIDIILSYQSKLSEHNSEGKEWKNLKFEKSDIESFFKVFLCTKIKEWALENNIKKKISQLSDLYSFPISNYEFIIESVREWYNLKPTKAAYITRPHVKFILYGEHNRKLANKIMLTFKDQYSFHSCKIIIVKPGQKYVLNINKIRFVLYNMYNELSKHNELLFKEVLFLDEVKNLNDLEDLLECFEVKRIKFLVISLINLPEDKIKRICRKIESILETSDNKKAIAVSQQVYFNNRDYIKVIEETISFDSLDDKSKKKILDRKLTFQGTEVKLKQLRETDHEDIDINEYIIMQLYGSYCLGKQLKNLGVKEPFYIPQKMENSEKIVFSETDFLKNSTKKIAVIIGEPGCGKTSMLVKLGLIWKQQNPTSWIIHLDFKLFKEYFKHNSISSNVLDFFCFHEEIKNDWEKQFMTLRKFVLIDGLDEIGDADRIRLISFIKNFDSSFFKILITTRSYGFIIEQLRNVLDIGIFNLVSFTSNEQITMFNNYVKFNFSKNMRPNISFKEPLNFPIDINICFNNPLLIEMMAEIYSDYMTEGIPLDINKDEFNTYQLFTLYLEKKRKRLSNPSDTDIQLKMFETGFNTNIEILRLLAMRNSFSTEICQLLNVDEYEDINKSVLDIGVLSSEKVFVHKMFEEYFATEYLWNLLKTKKKQILFIVLKEIFLNKEYSGICNFLNYFLELKETKELKCISEIYRNLLDDEIENEIDWGEEINFINLVRQKSFHLLKLLFNSCENCSRILNIEDANGMVAIHASVQDPEMLEYLVNKGAEIKKKDKLGDSVCHYTLYSFVNGEFQIKLDSTSFIKDKNVVFPNKVEENVLSTFKKLAMWDVNLNEVNNNNVSIVHFIALINFLKTLEFLSENFDLKLDTCNKNGLQPVHFAAMGNAFNIMQYMARKKINLEVRCNKGNSILHFAALHNSIKVLTYLIESCKMRVEVRNERGQFPQHTAACSNAVDIIKYFDRRNIDLNVLDNLENTILHNAACNNSINVLEYLMDSCSLRVDTCNKNGEYPQHHAALGNAIDVIKYFKGQNVNLNVLDNFGNTLLHLAALQNSFRVYEYLIQDCNMDIQVPNKAGECPQHFAALGDAVDIIKDFGRRNINLDVRNNDGNTLLHFAALSNSTNVVKYLIENCNMDIHVFNKIGRYPQHSAAAGNAVDVMKYFASRNVDFNVLDNDKNTLLHIAACYNSTNVYKYLTEECDMEEGTINKFGECIQHCAATGDAIDIIKYFKSRHVDFKVIDHEGNTLLHSAARHDSINVYKYLVEECDMDEGAINKFGVCPQQLLTVKQ